MHGDLQFEIDGPVALAVAHPGHELRLTRWISQARPAVFVLTAGSRSGVSRSRVEASLALLARLGASRGEVFGEVLDREVYGWLMAGETAPLDALVGRLTEAFVARRLRAVVADSWQLYNAVHDLWHLMVRAAAQAASQRLGWRIECLDYPVVPAVMSACAAGPPRFRLGLSPQQVAEKLALCADFPEISDDVAEVVTHGGQAFLALESLHQPLAYANLQPVRGEMPLYERFGEVRVAAGLYREVLRWRHVEPLMARYAEGLVRLGSAA